MSPVDLAQPWSCHVPEEDVQDLLARIRAARWADDLGGGWAFGPAPSFMHALVDRWTTGFDWREHEARLNSFPNRRVVVDGVPVHFIHQPGAGPDPIPLLVGHGWPGSIFELLDILPLLADPAAHGGDPADAFEVVAVSLPGHGFSYSPGLPAIGFEQMAVLLGRLMTDVLGHRRFAVHGHDWGAFIAAALGQRMPAAVVGAHVTLLATPRDPGSVDRGDPEQVRHAEELRAWQRWETGYSSIMATRPQTLAYALADSPVGLAAWIAEKFVGWSDPEGPGIDLDVLLANICTYWFTGAIGASFMPYHLRHRDPWFLTEERPVTVPVGYAEHPAEIVRPPRSLAARFYTDIRRWSAMPVGGHFPALEAPRALADEIRAFFRPLRAARA